MPTKINNYSLERIYSQDEINISRTHNSNSWKGCLSSHDYVVRERVLGLCSQTEHLNVYKLTKDNVTLSTIEVLTRDSWRVENGKVQNTKCACIGGVYVLPENRKKGLAKVMVDLVMEELKDKVDYTFLYSEVGEYYCKLGFVSMEVKLIKWNRLNEIHSKNELNGLDGETNGIDHSGNGLNRLDVHSNGLGGNDNFASNGTRSSGVGQKIYTDSEGYTIEELKFTEFGPLMDEYNHQTEAKLQAHSLTETNPTIISMNPSAQAIDWFHLRSKYIEHVLFSPQKYDFEHASYPDILSTLKSFGNQTFGLKVSHQSASGFIVWTQDWSGSESTLTILKIVVLQGDCTKMTKKLLATFNKFVSLWNISKITLWESEVSPEIKSHIVDSYKAITDIENGSRSAILMNDPQDHQKLLAGELIWAGNDKLPWFWLICGTYLNFGLTL